MQKKHTCFLLATVALAFAAASPAHAQASRTWVSGVGDDSFACSRTAPCKTFAGAISKTLAGGEINCLDPGGFGALTITKSITIDCHDVMGHILVASGNGINVNLDSAANMIVRIRNININGLLTSTRGISITGTTANANSNAVSIEDCLMDGFTQNGIANSAIGGRFLVKNTVIRNNFGSGLSISAVSGATAVKATLDNVSVFDSNFGFAFGNGAQTLIRNSAATGNTAAGVQLDPSASATIASSAISGNGTGILASAGSIVRVRDSDVAFNTVGFSGTIQSHVNNSFFNNGAGGTIVPVTGGVTNPQGLQ
jgi:Right handed beta helix region